MSHIHDVLKEVSLHDDNKYVLATVIKVEGSAYRKPGTVMLIHESGKMIGTLSAGCLEKDLHMRAKQLISSEKISETYVYDMSSEDDLGWGRGAGCNGKVHVLVEKVDSNLKKHLMKIRDHLEVRQAVTLIRFFNKEKSIKDYQLVPKDLLSFENVVSGLEESAVGTTYTHTFQPQERLIIFGTGPDVLPLASMAEQVGFSVIVWGWQKNYDQINPFLDSLFYHSSPLELFLEDMTLNQHDALVIMTHDFEKDKKILHTLLNYEQVIGYLGVLGPRKRTVRLMKNQIIPEKVNSPVGLSIHAEGPAEIAISILAQVIQRKWELRTRECVFIERKDYGNLSSSG